MRGNDLKFRHARLSEANSILQRDYANSIDRISRLEAHLAECQGESKRWREKSCDLESECQRASVRISELEGEFRQASARVSDLESECRRASARISELEGDCRQASEAAREATARTRASFDKNRSERAASERSMAATVAASARATNDDANARLAADRARATLSARARLDVQSELRQKAEAKADDAIARCETADREAERCRSEFGKMYGAMQAALDAKRDEVDRAERCAREAEARATREAREHASLDDEYRAAVERHERHAADAVERIASEAERLQAERARAAALERTIMAMERKVVDLQSQVEFLAHLPRGSHFGTYVKLKEENEDLHDQVYVLQKSLQAAASSDATPSVGGNRSTKPSRSVAPEPSRPRRRSANATAVHAAIDAL